MFKSMWTPIAMFIWIILGILNTIFEMQLLSLWLAIIVIIFLLYCIDKSEATHLGDE